MPIFDEPGFERRNLTPDILDDCRSGIVVLIAKDGDNDFCLAAFASSNLGADLRNRLIVRATEVAFFDDPENPDWATRMGQHNARALRVGQLIAKYGIPRENIAPPGSVGRIGR